MEYKKGLTISEQCNMIKDPINEYCQSQGGIAVVSENIDDKVLTGYNNAVGPKCLVVFVAEEPVGDEDTSELLGMTRRYFDIMVTRGKKRTDVKTSGLVDPSGITRPFYDQVEEIRDICREIIYPTTFCINPAEYRGMKPGNMDNWNLDSYIISISVLTQIARPSVLPPELSNGNLGPWIQLNDQDGLQPNTSI